MRCNNCGTENKDNAKFCEECGAKLNGSKGMPTSTKALIIAIIVLVVAVAFVGGIGLQNFLVPVVKNNTTTTVNNSTSPTASTSSSASSSQSNNQNNLISASEAESIANNHVNSQGLTAIGAQLINGPNFKYYQVTLAKTNNINTPVAYCDVKATTGEYLGTYT